ncbi:MAG: hypothetical protein AAGC58_00030 [Asticcacaulis sp.]
MLQNPAVLSAISALLGALIGGFVPLIGKYVGHQMNKGNRAQYAAIRCLIILDSYMIKLHDVACDNGEPDASGYYYATTRFEEIAWPDDIDWQSLDKRMRYDLLKLPQMCADSRIQIDIAHEHSSGPDYDEAFEARKHESNYLGLEVARIRETLRRSYKLGRPELAAKYAIAHFNENKAKVEETLSERLNNFRAHYPDQ